jgi:hypothetical protein
MPGREGAIEAQGGRRNARSACVGPRLAYALAALRNATGCEVGVHPSLEGNVLEVGRRGGAPTAMDDSMTVDPPSRDPCVGIFWRVGEVPVVDRSTLAEAEPYCDCLTHAARHYERWELWRRLGPARLAELGYPVRIVSTEYDAWPRGRIVYENGAKRFVIYADRRLQTPAATAALKRRSDSEMPKRL